MKRLGLQYPIHIFMCRYSIILWFEYSIKLSNFNFISSLSLFLDKATIIIIHWILAMRLTFNFLSKCLFSLFIFIIWSSKEWVDTNYNFLALSSSLHWEPCSPDFAFKVHPWPPRYNYCLIIYTNTLYTVRKVLIFVISEFRKYLT